MVTCSEEKVCESDPGYFCGPKNHCGTVIYTASKAIYCTGSALEIFIHGFRYIQGPLRAGSTVDLKILRVPRNPF